MQISYFKLTLTINKNQRKFLKIKVKTKSHNIKGTTHLPARRPAGYPFLPPKILFPQESPHPLSDLLGSSLLVSTGWLFSVI